MATVAGEIVKLIDNGWLSVRRGSPQRFFQEFLCVIGFRDKRKSKETSNPASHIATAKSDRNNAMIICDSVG